MIDDTAGIFWPHAGTVGHITVTHKTISGIFAGRHGNDGIACCCLLPAGKYRNGAPRAWCRTHQRYWGVKADLAALAASGVQRCASHAEPMGYVIDPLVLDMRQFAAISIHLAPSGIELEARPYAPAGPLLRASVPALALACDAANPLFGDPAIVQVNVTPPALRALGAARRSGEEIGCVDCARCGHPHLDLGTFAGAAHRRHYCGNCGHDATHSVQAMVSNPLLALLGFYGARLHITDPNVHCHTML